MPTSLRYTAARLAPVGILTIAAVMSGMFPFAERHVFNILTVPRGGNSAWVWTIFLDPVH